jgi:hypothetical protein
MPPKDLPKAAAATGWQPLRVLLRWGAGLILTCGILVSLAGVAGVMMPVSLFTRNMNLAPAVVAVYGSLRAGRAELAGGYRLEWNSSAEFLTLPHLATRFTLEGSDTRVTGEVQTGMFGIALSEGNGRAGPGLAQLVPGAWACDMTARLDGIGARWGWRKVTATGVITTPEGRCEKNGSDIAIPPLALRLRSEGREGVMTLTVEQTGELAEIRVSRTRQLGIVVQPAAADVFPQLPRGGPIRLTLPF